MSSKKIVGNTIIKIILSEWKLFTIIVIGIIVAQLRYEIPDDSFDRTIWSINREAYPTHEHYYPHDEWWRRVEVPDDSSEFFDYAFCFRIVYPPLYTDPPYLSGVGINRYERIEITNMILLSSENYRIDEYRENDCKNFRFPQRLGIGLFEVILEVFGIFLLLQYIITKLQGKFFKTRRF